MASVFDSNDSELESSVHQLRIDDGSDRSDILITCPMNVNGVYPEEADDFEIMDHQTTDDSDAMILPPLEDPRLPENDVFIIHGDGDADIVDKFSTLVTKFVKRNIDGHPIKVCTEDFFLDKATNKFELVKLGLECTPKQFVFLTSSKSKEDHWLKFKQEIAAVKIIEGNTASLTVIKTEGGIPVPFNLGACHDFLIPKLLKGKSLQDINVASITIDDLDARALENLSKLCNANVTYTLPYVYSESSLASEPITTEKGKIIQKNFTWFADHIDPENGLLGVLFSKEVIRFRQMDAMKKEKTFFLINEQLLNIVMRLNETKMEVFEKALIETNQEHVVEYLANPAVA